MGKKGENIRKRKDGRWEARYIKGRKPDGDIIYGYVYARRYSDAKRRRNEVLARLETDEDTGTLETEPVMLSFNQLVEEWKSDVRLTIRDSSYFLYNIMLEQHLQPCFGEMELSAIDDSSMQAFINSKMQEGLSNVYIQSNIILLRNILHFAYRKHRIAVPPATVNCPKMPKKQLNLFTGEELLRLESFLEAQDDDFSFGLLLCMFTGLRIGELSGLKWGDYDRSSEQIRIRRTVYRMRNEHYDAALENAKTVLHTGSPKTACSIRNIPIPGFLLEDVHRHQKSKDRFLLTGTTHCMEPCCIQKKYRKLLETCGLRYLNFHALRHNFATLAVQKGMDYKTLAELLGHSSINTTMNIYVHSSLERKCECIDLLKK
ncbi:MAG: site-specific integrase [Lachnospiraceae bacterium]|nr:site-specific integrase [Lachnospiraceae bacterium]